MTDNRDQSESNDAAPSASERGGDSGQAASAEGDSGNGVDGSAASDAETVVRRERFSGGPAREFLSSLAADERIFAADIAVDRAHVVMLAEQGVIDDEDAGEILTALEGIEAAGHDALPDGEDVHEAIETAVIDRVGPAGGRMHTARSRNDEVATCLRYGLRADVLALVETLLEARERLLSDASAEAETIMPGYTHLQSAQPTTVGHWLCSYEGALARDTTRLFDAYERINYSPLGAAAFAGTPYPIDRERTAALLGFDGLVENAMDAVSTRDFLLETNAAVVAVAITLSGLAEDAIVFAHDDLLELDDDYASTSSIMPQKKNPDTLELVRGRTGDAVAGLTGLTTTLKGLPRAYNRDLQRASGHTWSALDSIHEATEVAIGAITTATWNEEALSAAAEADFATATGVADRLAQAGIPFRTAHELVALAGESTASPTYETVAEAAAAVLDEPLSTVVDRETVEAALDPVTNVEMRDSRGGPAPSALEAATTRATDRLAADAETLRTHRQHVREANESLETAVNRYG